MFSPDARLELLRIARHSVAAHLSGAPRTTDAPVEGELATRAGAFVTLRRAGELRGCIGSLREDEAVARVVAHCAVSAATEDPRFPPMTRDELDSVEIEISVLTPAEPVEDPEREIEIGRHGLIVEQGVRRGLLLPQVPVEWKWDRHTYLSHTSMKAGLPPDAWRKGARVLKFEAEVFGEPEQS